MVPTPFRVSRTVVHKDIMEMLERANGIGSFTQLKSPGADRSPPPSSNFDVCPYLTNSLPGGFRATLHNTRVKVRTQDYHRLRCYMYIYSG